jgi:hypothetical protein
MAPRPNTKPPQPQIKPATLRTFHQALMDWYHTHGRHELPWRNTRDAYPIWLSEVMLQQTQVSTVLARFYHPFLERFPTLEALADAPREAVMKAWEGLGYYSRAANLHKTALAVTAATALRACRIMSTPCWHCQALGAIRHMLCSHLRFTSPWQLWRQM